jgi:hypothetical protein
VQNARHITPRVSAERLSSRFSRFALPIGTGELGISIPQWLAVDRQIRHEQGISGRSIAQTAAKGTCLEKGLDPHGG